MDDLTAFLAARLNEDETAAKAALGVTTGSRYEGQPREWVYFWSIRGPEQTIREVEAKRAIMTEHDPCYPTYYPTPSGQPTCGVCHSGGFDWDPERWPCATVRALAAVWSDHPDYRPEWKP